MARQIIRVDASEGEKGVKKVEEAVKDVGGSVDHRNSPKGDYEQVVAHLPDGKIPNIRSLTEVLGVETEEVQSIDVEEGEEGAIDSALTTLREAVETYSEEMLWWLRRVNLDELHKEGVTGEGVTIGIIDTGAYGDHTDLEVQSGRAYYQCGTDSEGNDCGDRAHPKAKCSELWSDDDGHGTHTAGIASAIGQGEGITGAAPDSDIRIFKALDCTGSGSWSEVNRAITQAVDDGCDIINMSLGGSSFSQAQLDACNYARENGSIVFAAAGNSGVEEEHYPANYEPTVAVGSTTREDDLSEFSTLGGVTFVAPGSEINSTTVDGGYGRKSGTSMASPLATGIGACLLSTGASIEGTVEVLKSTAVGIGLGEASQGAGLLDAMAAYEELNSEDSNRDISIPWDGGTLPIDLPNNGSDGMKELRSDASGKDPGPCWYFFDVSGDANLLDSAEEPDRIRTSPQDSDWTRLSGKIRSDGLDAFEFDGEIMDSNFMGAYGGLEWVLDGETRGLESFAGWDGGRGEDPEQPPPSPDPFPDGLPEGGYVPETTESAIMPTPGARNRDQWALHTTSPVFLYVSPDGDNSAAGTKSAPLASPLEAVNRLPLFLPHSVQVLLAPGTYDMSGGSGFTLGPHIQGFFSSSRLGLNIEGVGDSPEDMELNGLRQFNTCTYPVGSYGGMSLVNCTLNATLSVYRGGFGVEDAIINPTRGDGVAVAGYSSDIYLQGVEFGERTQSAVKVKEGTEAILNQCSGQVSGSVVTGPQGTVRDTYQNDIDHPNDSWGAGVNGSAPVDIRHGKTER